MPCSLNIYSQILGIYNNNNNISWVFHLIYLWLVAAWHHQYRLVSLTTMLIFVTIPDHSASLTHTNNNEYIYYLHLFCYKLHISYLLVYLYENPYPLGHIYHSARMIIAMLKTLQLMLILNWVRIRVTYSRVPITTVATGLITLRISRTHTCPKYMLMLLGILTLTQTNIFFLFIASCFNNWWQ